MVVDPLLALPRQLIPATAKPSLRQLRDNGVEEFVIGVGDEAAIGVDTDAVKSDHHGVQQCHQVFTRRCGLTRADLGAVLRQHGQRSPDRVQLTVYEEKGLVSSPRHRTERGVAGAAAESRYVQSCVTRCGGGFLDP